MDVSPLDLHLEDEFLPTVADDEDDDDSTKWEFDLLFEESTHDKECDVIHIPVQRIVPK